MSEGVRTIAVFLGSVVVWAAAWFGIITPLVVAGGGWVLAIVWTVLATGMFAGFWFGWLGEAPDG